MRSLADIGRSMGPADSKDDRTLQERYSHCDIVVGLDSCLGDYAGWACDSVEHAHIVETWVSERGDIRRVRHVTDSPTEPHYNPASARIHIYVVNPGHPALSSCVCNDCTRNRLHD